MIRVMIVDDSAVAREVLNEIFCNDPDLVVVGEAVDGESAVHMVMDMKPDVVTMDIHMPKVDGFEATRRIMECQPTPIVVVSGSVDTRELDTSFKALEAGALALVARPPGPGHPEYGAASSQLLRTVKGMSEVKVVKRWPKNGHANGRRPSSTATVMCPSHQVQLAAIGASTGGPVAMQRFLKALPDDLSVPVVIVQHMSPGFLEGFVDWLSRSTGKTCLIAKDGEEMAAGKCYVAPDGHHLGVNASGRTILFQDAPENGSRPSVSYLFRSVAQHYGRAAAAILLTGMGKDGAVELKQLHDLGAVTFAQDAASSVVHGMPGEAIRLGGANHVGTPEGLASVFVSLVKKN